MSTRQILIELFIEFGRNLQSELDLGALAELDAIFDSTVRSAVEERDYAWREPLTTFVLKHVGKIARLADAHAADGVIDADTVRRAADHVMTQARAAIKRRDEALGIPGDNFYSICDAVTHVAAGPRFRASDPLP